jgi:hypothetical protein
VFPADVGGRVSATDLLGADGPLVEALPGFAPRDTQLAMAQAVETAIDARTTLLVEAGTGTGKTFAYLVPALMSGRKVLLATGTRALQDQLFHRDLPTVQRALGLSVDTALLKGRANYLCHHRLERVSAGDFGADLSLLGTAEELALIALLASWPEMAERAARSHEPHRIAFFCHGLASEFHALWNKGNDSPQLRFIVADDEDVTLARLALIRAVALVIAAGLRILGVEPAEEMR